MFHPRSPAMLRQIDDYMVRLQISICFTRGRPGCLDRSTTIVIEVPPHASADQMAELGGAALPPIARQLKARIGAANALMQSLKDDPLKLAAASRVQRCAVVELTSKSSYESVKAEERCVIMELAMQAPWSIGDIGAVLDAISPQTADATTAKRPRRTQQDFSHFLNFICPVRWRKLLDTSVNLYAKKAVLVDLLVALGLRCPSEETYKMITTLWIIVGFPAVEVDRLGEEAKKNFLNQVKKDFDRIQRVYKEPLSIDSLPSSPDQLKASHSALYARAYEDNESGPIPCQISLARFNQVHATYQCRGNMVTLASSSARASEPSSQSMLEMMCRVLTQQQQQQQQRMDPELNIEFASRRGPKCLRSLCETANPLLSRLQRQALALPPPPQGVPSEADTPQEMQHGQQPQQPQPQWQAHKADIPQETQHDPEPEQPQPQRQAQQPAQLPTQPPQQPQPQQQAQHPAQSPTTQQPPQLCKSNEKGSGAADLKSDAAADVAKVMAMLDEREEAKKEKKKEEKLLAKQGVGELPIASSTPSAKSKPPGAVSSRKAVKPTGAAKQTQQQATKKVAKVQTQKQTQQQAPKKAAKQRTQKQPNARSTATTAADKASSTLN